MVRSYVLGTLWHRVRDPIQRVLLQLTRSVDSGSEWMSIVTVCGLYGDMRGQRPIWRGEIRLFVGRGSSSLTATLSSKLAAIAVRLCSVHHCRSVLSVFSWIADDSKASRWSSFLLCAMIGRVVAGRVAELVAARRSILATGFSPCVSSPPNLNLDCPQSSPCAGATCLDRCLNIDHEAEVNRTRVEKKPEDPES